MLEKIKAILGSIRFWIITLTAIVAVLQALVGDSLTIDFVFNTIEAWLIAVVGLGTLDSVATKIGK